jgi:glutathione synthase/RimK-type ligase-like ATP-grasp enzyme
VLQAYELSEDLANSCRYLCCELALALAGIDLRISPDGSVYCFEVNPSPAFSYYEAHTGQPIAAALAAYLSKA